MFPTTSTVVLSDKDNKEILFVKEEEANDAGVFEEVAVDVAGSQKEPLIVGIVRMRIAGIAILGRHT